MKAKSLSTLVLSAAAIGLAGCSNNDGAQPGAVSEGEAQALEEAAAMLDEQRVPIDAIAPSEAIEDNGETEETADLTGD